MDKRKKSRELPEEERKKVIAEHGKGKGYKMFPKDLHILVTKLANIKKFKVHGIIGNFPGCGRKRKIDSRLNRRIV